MTVTYIGEVPNGSNFGCFWKILGKWRGSVYKLVWRELLAYLFLYYSINFIYRYALNDDQQRIFEKIRSYFTVHTETIPMSFVLGFYVNLVVGRWWDQYKLLPWPDTLALYVSAGIPGADERGRLMRRNIVRYAVLAYVITLQRVSTRVRKRFPTWQHVVDSGLLLESEKKIIEMMDIRSNMSKYWMPLVWATNIINRARKESLITSDHIVQTMLVELSDIRKRLGSLIGFDTVNVPLVYTQVVTLALYCYFISALLGQQYVIQRGKVQEEGNFLDMYFPVFTVLQFCFYIGWVKVAEVLINPFGEDDDDIELNWLIDRHIKAAYMIVDEMHEEHPELLRDQYWEEVVPKDLPYTVASEHYRREEPKGSAEHCKIKQADTMYANLGSVRHHGGRKMTAEDMYADYESVDTPIPERRKNWFHRQITRMGSVRSSSTAYSSGGLFNRTRHNSVYASPEAGQPGFNQLSQNNGQIQPNPQHQHHQHQAKMSLYDRLIGRRSSRGQRQIIRQGTGKHNGPTAAMTVRNRPRIPTPDVTKEVLDREHRISNIGLTTTAGGVINPATIMAHQLNSAYQGDLPLVEVFLSPIQEGDGSSSHNNTLHAGQPGTAALAKAVLSPASLSSSGIGPVITANLSPATVSQLTSLGLAVTTSSNTNSPMLTRNANGTATPTTFTITDVKMGMPQTLTFTELSTIPQTIFSDGQQQSTPPPLPLTLEINTSDDDGNKSSEGSSVGGVDENISRKTSVNSQQTAPAGSPKRSEVYV